MRQTLWRSARCARQLCPTSWLPIEIRQKLARIVGIGGRDVELRGAIDVEARELLQILAGDRERDAGRAQEGLGERQPSTLGGAT